MVTAKITGHSPDDETARCLTEIDDKLRSKLARSGLVEPIESISLTLGGFLDQYIASRTDVRERTTINYQQAANNLTKYFGQDRTLASITPG